MIHLPPPIPTPGRLLPVPVPVRRRVPPVRTPRLWLPRWPALSPSKWRRPDARAMAWAFRAGLPIFKNGLMCFGCCPGGCGCASVRVGGGQCVAFCGAACTPLQVQLVFSGVSTVCASPAGGLSDWNGATLAGSVIADYLPAFPCRWARTENPGTTFNHRTFSSGTGVGSPTCTGTVSATHVQIGFTVELVSLFVGQTLRVRLSGQSNVFAGQTPFTTCLSTYTISNGTDPATTLDGGSGGSVTVTFCP